VISATALRKELLNSTVLSLTMQKSSQTSTENNVLCSKFICAKGFNGDAMCAQSVTHESIMFPVNISSVVLWISEKSLYIPSAYFSKEHGVKTATYPGHSELEL
jgi:hypothetical protein